MRAQTLHSAIHRRLVIAVTAIAMLCAQAVGYAHRIEHPHDIEDRVALALDRIEHAHGEGADSGHGTVQPHDCAAYDAATLGDGPPLSTAATAVAQVASERARLAQHVWLARAPALGYASRAPPRG